MKNKQYLTFRLHDLQYGIEAALVQEMFPLPELPPVPEATTNIMGLLNLRGQIVPIMHLDLLQGQPVKGCSISDYVIVLQWENLQIGIVVHQAALAPTPIHSSTRTAQGPPGSRGRITQ